MTMPWTRDHTKDWVSQLENRLEDIDYYLAETIKWCEDNEIYDDETVFGCTLITLVWVSHMRQEPISKREAMEILGIEKWDSVSDEEFILGEQHHGCDLFEILRKVAKLDF